MYILKQNYYYKLKYNIPNTLNEYNTNYPCLTDIIYYIFNSRYLHLIIIYYHFYLDVRYQQKIFSLSHLHSENIFFYDIRLKYLIFISLK